jgi:N6-L-threonylcarbamoyladenine synthase
LIIVREHNDFELIGQTQDDAAGEAFDKIAKIIGLPYPGGPVIDQLAKMGNPAAFRFPHPQVPNLDFSFSGLKTSILYFLNKRQQADATFTESHLNDICASVQATIVAILLKKLKLASDQTGIKTIAIAGGVSANSGLRAALVETAKENEWDLFIPPFQFCTDNAAMIAVAGYFKFLKGEFASQKTAPFARFAGL